MFAKVWEFKI